jgi:acetylornithine aminotransferase/acetylornithine/N-succinyldiaminopimelate aminotransferase
MWVGERAAELFQPGSHGTTFGGTPLACAAALAVLEIIEQEGLLEHVARTSPVLHAGLANLRDEFPALVRNIRGLGFMAGVELAVEPPPVVARLREAGLLCPAAGGNVIRLLPPLNTTADEIAEAVEIFRKVFASL